MHCSFPSVEQFSNSAYKKYWKLKELFLLTKCNFNYGQKKELFYKSLYHAFFKPYVFFLKIWKWKKNKYIYYMTWHVTICFILLFKAILHLVASSVWVNMELWLESESTRMVRSCYKLIIDSVFDNLCWKRNYMRESALFYHPNKGRKIRTEKHYKISKTDR